MRILLDESLPWRLGPLLVGHDAVGVVRHGWSGLKNGALLRRAAAEFDVFVTADRALEFQQNLSTLPIAVIVLLAPTNRLESLRPLVPDVLLRLTRLEPRSIVRIGEWDR